MKKTILALVAAVALLAVAQRVEAGNSDSQTVTLQVDAINELVVTGDPAMTINAAVAGSGPTSATNSATTYAITTNQNRKLTAVLSSAMPGNTTLHVTLTAPTGGTAVNNVQLSDSPADVLSAIAPVAESGLQIAYTFAASVAAGTVASTTRAVTFTIAAP
jgi:hypothetical protein